MDDGTHVSNQGRKLYRKKNQYFLSLSSVDPIEDFHSTQLVNNIYMQSHKYVGMS